MSSVAPRAVGQVERIDALVNCYRLESIAAGAVEDLDLDVYVRTISDNLTDGFFASQAAALQMIAAGRAGVIVNVTSVAGVVSLPGPGCLLLMHGRGVVAHQSAGHRVGTPWHPRGSRRSGLSEDLLDGLRAVPGASRRVPPGALVDHESLARTVLFVLSDAARSIAGVPVYVDAGWLADGYWEPFL